MEKGLDQDLKVLIKKHGIKTMKGFSNMGSVTNLSENKTLFIPCDCRSEILVIEYDHEYKMADVAIYEHGVSLRHKMSLYQRLRYCWHVFFNKKPYADQIMLDNRQLLDLKNFINDLDLS